jgi:hypothetical protein
LPEFERHLWIHMSLFQNLSNMSKNAASTDNADQVQLGEDDKYMVAIFSPPKAVPSPKESLEAIKGAVKGKMLARMKKEAVDCPVKLKVVSFVECFTCPNFNRRIRGKVGCKGLPLPAK